MKWLIAVACVAGLGAIAGTVYVGSKVREDTVVARPYEEGLGSDAEREARGRLGWSVEVPAAPVAPGAPLVFTVRDRAGAPLEDAAVTVVASRAGTSRGQLRADARAAGAPGRHEVLLPLGEPGRWDVRFEISRGADRLRLTRAVVAGAPAPGAAAAPCQLAAGPCRLALDGGLELALALAPLPPRTMTELALEARLTRAGAPVDGAALEVALAMVGMDMGPNVTRLAPAGGGRYAGNVVLVRCPSGRKDWTARVALELPGAPRRTVEAALEAAE